MSLGSTSPAPQEDARQFPRLSLPAMYTLMRFRYPGEKAYRHAGHVYDISMSGARFEADHHLPPGTLIETRMMLPGVRPITFRAIATVVRVHGDIDDLIGPSRMGLRFTAFNTELEAEQLRQYLDERFSAMPAEPVQTKRAA